MISIICVYNNEPVLNNYLLKNLKNQSAAYELILLDNRTNKFSSAAAALNQGGKQAKGDYLIFIHQDVTLPSLQWLEDAEQTLKSISNLGVAGLAGKAAQGHEVLANMTHGLPPRPAGDRPISSPTKVQTVDECLSIIPGEIFKKMRFDEETCDGWHLYAVDYCLSIASLGYDIYVLPQEIYHLSTGIVSKNLFQIIRNGGIYSKDYYINLKKILKKHKATYRCIYTTCGNWNTNNPILISHIKNLSSRLWNPKARK